MRDRERGRDSHLHREFVEIFPSCPAKRAVAGGVEETDKGAAFSDRDRLWVNVVDGFVTTETPGNFRAVRGGMLCDEPGLGKTITVLALLLRTRGLLPGECLQRQASTSQLYKRCDRFMRATVLYYNIILYNTIRHY